MATECCCGNQLERLPASFRVRMSPCKCDAPGASARMLPVRGEIPEYCFAKQYEQRRRLGLPLETDTERGIRSRWV